MQQKQEETYRKAISFVNIFQINFWHNHTVFFHSFCVVFVEGKGSRWDGVHSMHDFDGDYFFYSSGIYIVF